jgi:hypothetical protein
MSKLEERVRATAAATLNEGKRSAKRLLRRGRHAVEDSVEETTHRIKLSAAAILLKLTVPYACAQVQVINVSDPRPMADAMDARERIVHTTINYEDPPYENMADLQDVSTPAQRAAQTGYKLLVPRPGSLSAGIPWHCNGIACRRDL